MKYETESYKVTESLRNRETEKNDFIQYRIFRFEFRTEEILWERVRTSVSTHGVI